MTPRKRRMVLVLGILAGVGLAAALATQAFKENVMFFFDPSQIVAGEAPVDKRFRLGGMVEPGTCGTCAGQSGGEIRRYGFQAYDCGALQQAWCLICFARARAWWRMAASPDGVFVADEVLAKHDENYMPPEVERSLKEKHGGKMRRPRQPAWCAEQPALPAA